MYETHKQIRNKTITEARRVMRKYGHEPVLYTATACKKSLQALLQAGMCRATHREVPQQEIDEWRRGKTICFEGVEYKAHGRE